MFRIYSILFLWAIFVQIVISGENFIVLESGNAKEKIMAQKKYYENTMQENKTIQNLLQKHRMQVHIKKVDQAYLLKVGPFKSSDALAMVYFESKKSFPYAFILEENTVEKKIYINRPSINKQEDNSLWLALFGLALIGIFFMFLSSEKMKRMKNEQDKIKLKHTNLEQKQNEALSSMSENIQIIAKETMQDTYRLAAKVKNTSLYDDVTKVIHNENELLDVAGDLVKFLRLKSKKVVIQHEEINFNHVMNEVAGLLNTKYKQNDIELVFDIDKDIPKYMFSDSVHLGQILINLLEYFIEKSQNKEIIIEVTTKIMKKKGIALVFQINADINIENKGTLFNLHYDEEKKRYIGLGLFVAKELTYLMDGKLQIKDRSYDSTILLLTLPITVKKIEKRKYRLPNKGFVGKKMLIVDRSESSALASKKLFSYFKIDIDILSMQTFFENEVSFFNYEIVALHNTLFSKNVLNVLEEVKEKQVLKIISLENLFTSENILLPELIDVRLKKPLTQEYVFDTIIKLYAPKNKRKNKNITSSNRAARVYAEAFEKTENITLKSFHSFKKAHILIVEDDVVNQNNFIEVLGGSRIKISLANNGQESVDFLSNIEEHIDIVFMDINMPVMDGYTAAKMIRENARLKLTSIIFLSALVSEHEIEKMLESGMNGYLEKPLQLEQLYTVLKTFLNQVDSLASPMCISEPIPLVFKGLNVKIGIKNLNGNIVFYKQVLQEFLDAYAQSASIFKNLVKEKRYGQVKVLCLEMKGLTSTIGAKEMHTVINEIHQYIVYKKPELLTSYIKPYREKLEQLSESIRRYLLL